ncbi:metallophosphoesterase family protein [Thermomonospora umbrina]|uniref:Icc-related predicted phosphoesterase n=1 Tax=Thermomonospora umbrina TaxID=111806 RepID=A0A3D9SID9_9ACTN|nr:metallophosphoesterase [Thermomonospora umbrina]REE95457.1 Icc-related predicted phosphoesterase [Thermomonospora umbrina]
MKVAFFGDVHGCALHALAAAIRLQRHRGVRLDALVQVGDLGAYPSAERWDGSSRRFAVENPAQHDFFRLLDPSPPLADAVRAALEEVPPFVFLSGNHEDHEWLEALHRAADSPVVTSVDPLGVFRHVACGNVIEVAGLRTAFLGLIELPGRMDLDPDAYARLLDIEPGGVDVLITHDGPYGMNEYRGVVQGSPKLSALIERLRPRLHVGGHYHHENGPRRYGPTVSYALAQLVPPWRGGDSGQEAPPPRIAPGSIGLLDTETLDFEYVDDPWLADDLDLGGLLTAR